ncbi:MAG: GyrI-like domain-containing protein [Sporomusaceae bacterium]|nr:GyrI-like domain-containing protein [Sporomusaceae bacterium]
MAKVDYKKACKELYSAKTAPALVNVPALPFIMIDGQGDPQAEDYQQAVALLYTLSYCLKMKGKDLAGYFDYVVPPLESLWWHDASADWQQREAWHWTAMIRQPEFVTPAAFEWAAGVCRQKKPQLPYSLSRLETFTEGLCVQAMHVGPYRDEPATVASIRAFIDANGLIDMTGEVRKHHEIYLSDPHKTPPAKLNTVIRLPVASRQS